VSDHGPDTVDGFPDVTTTAQTGARRASDLISASEVDGAVCGPVCVSAGTCTCVTGPHETVPDQEVPGVQSSGAAAAWAPAECTLPLVQQPERVAEFAALFSAAVRAVARPEPTRLRLVLDPASEAAARDPAARESGCCSFFTFTFARRADGLHLEITVPSTQVAVQDALAEQAAAAVAEVRR
jgi:hypothetical protein